MRCALALVVVAACGGAAKPPPPITNAPPPRAAPAWTLSRVLATLPPDTDALVVLDMGRLRASSLVGPYWNDLMAMSRQLGGGLAWDEACPDLMRVDGTFVLSLSGSSASDLSITMWMLGVPARRHFECSQEVSRRSPDRLAVRVDGDVMVSEVKHPTPALTTSLAVDATTLIVRAGAAPIDRATIVAALEPRAQPFTSPELTWLAGADPAVWSVVRTSGPLLGALLGGQIHAVGISIEVGDDLVADVRMRMVSPPVASEMARAIEGQLDTFVQNGMLDDAAVDVRDAVSISIHATMRAPTAKRVIAQLAPLFRSALAKPVPPPAPIVAPAPPAPPPPPAPTKRKP